MKNIDKDSYWLIFGLIIVVLSIILTVRSSITWFLWLLAVLVYAIIAKNTSTIGITRDNFKAALIVSVQIAIIYGILRAIILLSIPGSEYFIGAGLIETVIAMEMGKFPIGDVTGTATKIFLIMFIVSLFTVIMWESFFRGLLFNKVKIYVHWTIAVVIVAILSGLPHSESFSSFFHSIILGLIGGILMQRYHNVVAPAMFHFLHFQVALVLLWIFK